MKVQVNLCKPKQTQSRVRADVTVVRRKASDENGDAQPVVRVPVRPARRPAVQVSPAATPAADFSEAAADAAFSDALSAFDDIFSGVTTNYRPGADAAAAAGDEHSDDIFSILDDIDIGGDSAEEAAAVSADETVDEQSDDIFSILDDIDIGEDTAEDASAEASSDDIDEDELLRLLIEEEEAALRSAEAASEAIPSDDVLSDFALLPEFDFSADETLPDEAVTDAVRELVVESVPEPVAKPVPEVTDDRSEAAAVTPDAASELRDVDPSSISIRFFDRSDSGQRMEVEDASQASGQEVAFYDSDSGKLSRVCGIIRKSERREDDGDTDGDNK